MKTTVIDRDDGEEVQERGLEAEAVDAQQPVAGWAGRGR